MGSITSIIANSNKVPGRFLKVSLGVGQRAGGATFYVVCIGNQIGTGMTAAAEYDCYDEDQARSLAGAKSELFWMFKAAVAAYPGVAVKLMAVAESAGANATGTLTFSGTATSAGTIGVTVLGEEIEIPFAAGDTAAVIGPVVNTYIGNKSDWPVVPTVVTAVVTLTAANKGPRGNDLAFRARIIAGTGITVAASGSGFLAGGTTSDDPQACLDAQASLSRRYLVAPYADATNLAKFKTHVDAQDEPEIGHRKLFVAAGNGTSAAEITIATGLNFGRGQIFWQEKADLPPSMQAAACAAYRAKLEAAESAPNFDFDVVPGLKPHSSSAYIPTNTALDSALNNGLTPLMTAGDGSVYIVRSITTRSQDIAGKPDFRVLDTHKVVVPDAFADWLDAGFGDRFGNMKASADPPDGDTPAPNVCTPSMVKDFIFEGLNLFEKDLGLLDSGSVDRNAASVVVELSSISNGRFNAVIPLDVIELVHQFAGDVRQIG